MIRFLNCGVVAAMGALLVVTAPANAQPRHDRCVVLVSVDGLAHFYVDDLRADMPTVRRLAREGARTDGMVTCFPSVTWPAHTTIATGMLPCRHGVVGNSYLDRETGKEVPLVPDPLLDKDRIVHVPTVYDVAHRAGLKTAAIVWPATRNATTLDWTVPDMFGDEAWPRFGTKSWLDELRGIGLPVDRYGTWTHEPAGGVPRDWLYARMAAQVLKVHSPNLLMIHFVEPDHVQHRCGPRSEDAYWCMSYADDRVRDLVEAVERSPMAGKTTFVLCGDHGFLPINREIRPNVLLRQEGLIALSDGKISTRSAWAVSQGGSCQVYVLDQARRSAILQRLCELFGHLEGVAAVFPPEQFASLGQPSPEQDPHAPDLWLAAKSGYTFGASCQGSELVGRLASAGGTHGYLPDQPDMLAACVIWGPGIPAGTKLGKVRSVDLAPTIAAILGLDLPGAEGKTLVQAR